MDWQKIYQKSFLLHTNPRPQIIINHGWKSGYLNIKLSKVASWDINFLGWAVPVIFTPHGKSEDKYTRLYKGIQTYSLNAVQRQGSLEIKPRLWIPDLTVEVWEAINMPVTDECTQNQATLERIEYKIDDLTTYGNP